MVDGEEVGTYKSDVQRNVTVLCPYISSLIHFSAGIPFRV